VRKRKSEPVHGAVDAREVKKGRKSEPVGGRKGRTANGTDEYEEDKGRNESV